MKGIFQRRGDGFFPARQSGQDVLASVKEGGIVVLNVRASRNLEQLEMFWALCQVVAEADDDTKDNVKRWALHELGYIETWLDKKTGKIHIETRSIAEENMEQDEFNAFFQLAKEKLAERLQAKPVEFMRRYNEILAGRKGRRQQGGSR